MMNIIIPIHAAGHTVGAVGICIPTPFSAFQPWPVERHSYLPDPSFLLAHAFTRARIFVKGLGTRLAKVRITGL